MNTKKLGSLLLVPTMLFSLYGCSNMASEFDDYIENSDIELNTISFDDLGTEYVTDVKLKTENAEEILTDFLSLTETIETFKGYEEIVSYQEQIKESLDLFNMISEDLNSLEIPPELVLSESVGSFFESSLNTVNTYANMLEEINNLEVTKNTLPEEFSKEVESIVSAYDLEAIQEPYMEDLKIITEEFNLDAIYEILE